MNRIVINTTNEKEMYSFFLPLTTMIWNKVIGYSPISFIVGSEEVWMAQPKLKLIVEETRKYSRIEWIPEHHMVATHSIAQVSRLYASALHDLPGSDYIITSDVDMFPTSKQRFHQQDWHKPFHIFNHDAYGYEPKYAMCYLGGLVSAWRDIMKIEQLGLVNAMEQYAYHGIISNPDKWNQDEKSFYEHITKWSGWKHNIQFIPRAGSEHNNYGRLDRAGWRYHGPQHTVDAHLLRPGFIAENWEKIFELIRQICGPYEIAFAKQYYNTYIGL